MLEMQLSAHWSFSRTIMSFLRIGRRNAKTREVTNPSVRPTMEERRLYLWPRRQRTLDCATRFSWMRLWRKPRYSRFEGDLAVNPAQKSVRGRFGAEWEAETSLPRLVCLASAALSSFACKNERRTAGSITDNIALRTDSPRHRIG